jgi:hypothetical protein
MSAYETEIAKVFADSDALASKIDRLLPTSNDLVGLVLRGHLIVEELLFAACTAYCRDPAHLKMARLRFPQLVSLLRALEKIPAVPPAYWSALLELNSLRNTLAHQLEHQDLGIRTARFVIAVGQVGLQRALPKPDTSPEALKAALHYIIGGLQAVAVWHSALETLLRARSLESKCETVS